MFIFVVDSVIRLDYQRSVVLIFCSSIYEVHALKSVYCASANATTVNREDFRSTDYT